MTLSPRELGELLDDGAHCGRREWRGGGGAARRGRWSHGGGGGGVERRMKSPRVDGGDGQDAAMADG